MYGGGSIVDISRSSGRSSGRGSGSISSTLAGIQKQEEQREGKQQDQAFLTKIAKAQSEGATPEQLMAIAAAPVAPIGLLSRIIGKSKPGPVQQSFLGQMLQSEMKRSDPRYQADLETSKARTGYYNRMGQGKATAATTGRQDDSVKFYRQEYSTARKEYNAVKMTPTGETFTVADKKARLAELAAYMNGINEKIRGVKGSPATQLSSSTPDSGPDQAVRTTGSSLAANTFSLGGGQVSDNNAPAQLKAITDSIAGGIDKFKGIFDLTDIEDLQSIIAGGDLDAIGEAMGRIFDLLKNAGKGIGKGIAAIGDAADAAATGDTLLEFLGK